MDVRRITINIAGRNYPLNVPAEEETSVESRGNR